jgi:para-aminobenzoate synthetase / 4-amino-4-deoxychorismate lyase
MTAETMKYALHDLAAGWHKIVATSPGSVLLKTSRTDVENRRSYLFSEPVKILTAHALAEIPTVFDNLEAALKSGRFVCGFISYEAGYHFEPTALSHPGRQPEFELPLVWFGVYSKPLVVLELNAAERDSGLETEDYTETNSTSVDLSRAEYFDRIQRIRKYIEAGDLYQANFTIGVNRDWSHGAGSLFKRIMDNQPVPYGAFLNAGETQILSASPELFFRKQGSQILVRPMKGTSRRGRDIEEDAERAAWLATDEKNRAENLMIVDLLRSDLGRICRTGSIIASDLFSVHRYPDLLQMTSTVKGDLKPGTSYYDIFRSLFPCGSITGAPKIRTMQVIRELESESRGIACGAIGFISPDGEAVFSVAIRTPTLRNCKLTMRVGSGVTYDSDPNAEYEECLLKAKFLTAAKAEFSLIETILWDQEYFLLDLHLERLSGSAEYFDIQVDLKDIHQRLESLPAGFVVGARQRVRILLSQPGLVSIDSVPLPDISDTGLLTLSTEHTDSTDALFRHKTTRRAMYDRVYAEARERGFDDAVFLNERGEVTECAVHNLMIRKNGKLMTPQTKCGLLPGVFRRHLLLKNPEILETTLTVEDLLSAESIYIFNSVRGLRSVRIDREDG